MKHLASRGLSAVTTDVEGAVRTHLSLAGVQSKVSLMEFDRPGEREVLSGNVSRD